MRTGIFLLGIIACSLAIGSIVSQEIYHTPFFYVLLLSLCVNIILCSGGRLWKNRLAIAKLPDPQKCKFYTNEFVHGTDSVRIRAALEQILKAAGFKTTMQEDVGQYVLHGERGLIGAWGIFGAHMSVILIAAGVLYGAYAGFETTVSLTEGTNETIMQATEPVELTLNKFQTLYYEDGTVAEWIADVTVEQNRQLIVRRDIKVNHPLTFSGGKIYLVSQGALIQTQILNKDNNISSNVEAAQGDEVGLPGSDGARVRILRYIPDYDPLQPLVSKTLQPRNSYIICAILRDGEPEKRRAIKLNDREVINEEASIVFAKVLPVVGLHVKYDPGLPFVWAGFGLLILGFGFNYYMPHRQIWVYVTPENEGLVITCTGRGVDLSVIRDQIRSLSWDH